MDTDAVLFAELSVGWTGGWFEELSPILTTWVLVQEDSGPVALLVGSFAR